jgi:hypothetical protein
MSREEEVAVMPATATFCDDPVRVEVRYSGAVVPDDITSVAAEALALAQENGTFHVLTDCTAMTSNPSVFTLYDLASTIEQLGLARVYREAVVVSEDRSHETEFEFYENTMVNRGLSVRRFRRHEEARSWLADADGVGPPRSV